MRKLDLFTHIFPRPFFDRMLAVAGDLADMGKRVRSISTLYDLERRFRVMQEFGDDYQQVISLASPPIEVYADAAQAVELARLANDGMAELVAKHPDRFPAFVAALPMLDVDASLREIERAVGELGACGVQVFTNVKGRPLDDPDFFPVFESMARGGRPIWLHPARGASLADYATEQKSRFEIWWTLGWPYETSAAMARLVFSRTFDRLPDLKIITHHMGGLVPYLEGRVGHGWDVLGERTSDEDYVALRESLLKRPLDYFKENFYADTALFGSRAATLCGLEFFGVERVLFASDCPFDPEGGSLFPRETIRILDKLEISEEARARIYHVNAEKLLGLPPRN